MKPLLLTVITGIALWLSPSLYADSITTGILNFECSDCGAPTGSTHHTAPTQGSFSFDTTTGQFLSVDMKWDGFEVAGPPPSVTNPAAIFEQLITTGAPWTFVCISTGDILCDQRFWMVIDSNLGFLGLAGSLDDLSSEKPKFFFDDASGTVTARNLEDPVTTPEPSVLTLALVGLLASVGILIYRQGLWKHDR
jgi:hypothetical protein